MADEAAKTALKEAVRLHSQTLVDEHLETLAEFLLVQGNQARRICHWGQLNRFPTLSST